MPPKIFWLQRIQSNAVMHAILTRLRDDVICTICFDDTVAIRILHFVTWFLFIFWLWRYKMERMERNKHCEMTVLLPNFAFEP